ncbi:MAG: hypothetical protein HQM12_18655, partial [SAR324 cluster bacterium]|nr:hypothetical protein [SAR324 cluster bacterium]
MKDCPGKIFENTFKKTFIPIGWMILSVLWGIVPVQSAETVPPLQHAKKVYVSPEGKTYFPQTMPVHMFLSGTESPAGTPEAKAEQPAVKATPTVQFKEGLNVLQNMATQTAWHIYADGTPPETSPSFQNTTVSRQRKQLYAGKALEFQFVPLDSISGSAVTMLSLNGNPFKPFKEVALDFTGEALFVMQYYSVDHVGNAEAVKSLTFQTDLTPPTTRLEFKGVFKDNIISPLGTITFVSDDTLSGVAEIWYQIDQGKLQKYKDPVSVTDLDKGFHQLLFYAVDYVKNQEVAQKTRFYYDATAPTVALGVNGAKYLTPYVFYISSISELRVDTSDDQAQVGEILLTLDDREPMLYKEPFLITEPGMHRINYVVRDQVQNLVEGQWKVYVDQEPPVTEYNIHGPSFWNGDTVIITTDTEIEFTSTDMEANVKEIWYCFDPADCQIYEKRIKFAKEGSWKISYYAMDYVNNLEPAKTLSIVVDNQSNRRVVATTSDQSSLYPKKWFFDEKQGLIGAADLEFFIRISDSDDPKAVSHRIDTTAGDKPTPLFFKSGGKNNLKIDIAGLKEIFPIQIDATPPATQSVFGTANSWKNNQTVFYGPGLVLKLLAKDGGDGIYSGVFKTMYSIDGSDFIPYTDPVQKFFNEKSYLVRYFSVDNVGNIEAVTSHEFTIDLAPPKTTHTIGAPFYGSVLSEHSMITLTSNDGVSGVKNIFYQFDDEPVKSYRNPFTGKSLRELKEGPHTLVYYAEDPVGNAEKTKKFSFSLDHTPPEVKFTVSGEQHENQGKTY